MFSCRACLQRSFNAIASSGRVEKQPLLLQAPAFYRRQRQAYATTALGTNGESAPTTFTGTPKGSAPRSAKKLEWIVNKHLEHLGDPYNIANHVLKILERGDYEEALLLTQKASKDAKVTVSWNHLIDYQLKNQKLHAGVKLYNDMKKRGQSPNAQTYTILFRGFAASQHPKLAVSEAFRIYQNMLKVDRIKPNTIHMNAVIDVCSRAHDIDLMFTVIDTANTQFRAPDSRTYTIILNALRSQVDSIPERRGLDEAEHQKNVETAVMRAKAVWQDVVKQWRQNKIVMDESLACAMGRILLNGDHRDRKSIMALLEQTMQLPVLENVKTDSLAGWFSQQSALGNLEEPQVATPPVTRDKSLVKPATYAVPTQNTLSLVMSSLRSTKNTSLAPRYWQLLTEQYQIVPDRENYTRYLKALQHSHASTKTAELMPTIPQHLLAPKYFRIALQSCINDNLNQHAFNNACRIFDVMVEKMRYPDAMAMRLFLHAARANYRHFQEARNIDPVAAKMALGKQIAAALDRMWEPFRILSSSLSYPTQTMTSPEQEWQATLNTRVEIVAVARRMMAAIDSIVSENMAEPSVIKVLKTRNTIIRRYVSRFNDKNTQMQKRIANDQTPPVDTNSTHTT